MDIVKQEQLYKKLSEISATIREKFPDFESFQGALKDPVLGQKIVDTVVGIRKGAGIEMSPQQIQKFKSDLGTQKYSQGQKDLMSSTALAGLKELYKGDFDKLIANKDKLPEMIQRMKQDLTTLPLMSSEYKKTNDTINNLSRGLGLVNAYDAITSADTDQDYDRLIQGERLETRDEAYSQMDEVGQRSMDAMGPTEGKQWKSGKYAPDKYLKQVMPSAEYKALGIPEGGVGLTDVLFPDVREREGFTDKAIGVAHNTMDALSRMVRPGVERMAGVSAPGLSYMEEVARPDRYKTAGQEAFDDVFGLQGLGRTGVRKGAEILSGVAPALVRKPIKAVGAFDPYSVIVGNVLGKASPADKFGQIATRELIKEAPNIALDMAYEGTRDDIDPEMGMLLAGLGGVGGAMLAPSVKAGNQKFRKLLGKSELKDELTEGSVPVLRSKLAIAKNLMPAEDFTSRAGRQQLAGVGEEITGTVLPRIGGERDALIEQLTGEIAQAKKDRTLSTIDRMMGGEGTVTPEQLAMLEAFEQVPGNIAKSVEGSVHPRKQGRIMEEIFSGEGVLSPEGITPESLVKGRTKMRQYSEGSTEGGMSQKAYGKAEDAIRDAMNDFLGKSETGKAVQKSYADFKEAYDVNDVLNTLVKSGKATDVLQADKVDALFRRIGNSRMRIGEQINFFDKMVDFQDQMNKVAGTNIDVVTPAVLRRVESREFWDEWFGEGTPGMVRQAVNAVKEFGKEAFTRGKLRATLSNIAKLARERSEESERQKSAKPDEQLTADVLAGAKGMSEVERRWKEAMEAEVRRRAQQ